MGKPAKKRKVQKNAGKIIIAKLQNRRQHA
jgi:hypothetical protein